ncbi:hypothetical protein [Bosea sp. BK604]|uniref:hypothetical protein n=1 Tax=Bosea sp. BK604 TaxID=2512180 RepID=UPI0010472F80|nr:hypothetical protein [Bosea sp. BK604]
MAIKACEMLQFWAGRQGNLQMLGAALLLGPALLALSSWMDLLLPEIEAVLAGAGYVVLTFAVVGLSQNWGEGTVPGASPADAKAHQPGPGLVQLAASLRRYGLLLTIATIALTANALVIAAYASSPQVTPRSLLSVIETQTCPNFWAALFINCLALLGWADLARSDR